MIGAGYYNSEGYGEYFGSFDLPNPLKLLTKMIEIRVFEEKMAHLKEHGHIVGPVHLAAGQEAIPVALSALLRDGDKLYGGHRCHGHFLALTADKRGLLAEVLGRASGCSGGYGGSMHLFSDNPNSRFGFSTPIIANTVPIALGYAFSNRTLPSDKRPVSCASIGDGAIEEGVVFEAANIAALTSSPLLIVCENNLMASHLHLSQRRNNFNISSQMQGMGLKVFKANGNDLAMCFHVLTKAIEIARQGVPTFVEFMTYRHYGHVDYRKDNDVGLSRSLDDYEKWMKKDPIVLLSQNLIQNNPEIELEIRDIWKDTRSEADVITKSVLDEPICKP